MKGRELCRRYYSECVRGIIQNAFPGLEYSAGLLGFGSDVLGYDDDVSRDHMWGPRLYVFLKNADIALKDKLMQALIAGLPREFCGFPTGFGAPNEEGISSMAEGDDEFRPLITIETFEKFMRDTLGVPGADGLSASDWLAFSEHKLLTLSAGEVYHDGLGIGAELYRLRYYPDEVWLYLLMSDWSCLAEERAFVKRTASRGDDMGSRIICARLAQRIMHLCFLYERRYAPYAKWFGTAFGELKCAPEIKPLLEAALGACDMPERERAIAQAQARLIEMHNRAGLTAQVSSGLHSYFDRDILVADSDLVCGALQELLKGGEFGRMPPLGSVSAVGNLVPLTEDPNNFELLKGIYKAGGVR